MRIYELARQLNMSSKELVEKLEELGVEVKSHMSTLDEETAELVVHLIEEERTPPADEGEVANVLELAGAVTVGELAQNLGVGAGELIKELMNMGVMATINQRLDEETIEKVADAFGYKVIFGKAEAPAEETTTEEEQEEYLEPRPPVVTVMGHVDHGKTTLLDTIRRTNVAAREKGGITQHIGASVVEVDGSKIVFIDTPGHEAFTAMRARGAQVTDIVVLVVAADDGVMPQTVEAINHAKAAGVPIIVAINKIDKPEANPDKVKLQLMEHGLVAEEYGGDTIVVNVSALKGDGVKDLLEMILLQAELLELKANPKKLAKGVVIEAKVDKGRGPVATVVVQEGTLRVGDIFVCGTTWGKVRALIDDKGERVKEAPPATPVEVLGFSDVPQAGDKLEVLRDEREARRIVEQRLEEVKKKEEVRRPTLTLEELYQRVQEGEARQLNLIVKGDVQGSVEALCQALSELSSDEVKLNIIHSGVGNVSESDVVLAEASEAIIIGFHVKCESKAEESAKSAGVQIRLYDVIYEVIDDVKAALAGMLEPVYKEVLVGVAEVREVFNIPRVGQVAGCYVREGRVQRGAKAKVVRNGDVLHEGEIASLKRFKEDVREVQEGYECGLTVSDFSGYMEGDLIEVYQLVGEHRAL